MYLTVCVCLLVNERLHSGQTRQRDLSHSTLGCMSPSLQHQGIEGMHESWLLSSGVR